MTPWAAGALPKGQVALDVGVGWQHGITGKYLMRDMTRFEVRYRF